MWKLGILYLRLIIDQNDSFRYSRRLMSIWRNSICEDFSKRRMFVSFMKISACWLLYRLIKLNKKNVKRDRGCQTTANSGDIVLKTWFEENLTPPYVGIKAKFRFVLLCVSRGWRLFVFSWRFDTRFFQTKGSVRHAIIVTVKDIVMSRIILFVSFSQAIPLHRSNSKFEFKFQKLWYKDTDFLEIGDKRRVTLLCVHARLHARLNVCACVCVCVCQCVCMFACVTVRV